MPYGDVEHNATLSRCPLDLGCCCGALCGARSAVGTSQGVVEGRVLANRHAAGICVEDLAMPLTAPPPGAITDGPARAVGATIGLVVGLSTGGTGTAPAFYTADLAVGLLECGVKNAH